MENSTKRQRYAADFNIQITVFFDDDGENDMVDQAYNAASLFIPVDADNMKHDGLEMVGQVRLEAPSNAE